MLSPDEIRAVNQPIGEALGLPNKSYVSDEFLALEYQQVMGAGWIGVAFDDDVAEPGDLFPVVAAGQPLLVVRDNDRRIRVFHNVCRHRGTQLVDQPCSDKQQIVCPYHAWTYGLGGDLMATPNFRGPAVKERSAFPNGDQNLIENPRVRTWLTVGTFEIDLDTLITRFNLADLGFGHDVVEQAL